jgi:hypothetical protein
MAPLRTLDDPENTPKFPENSLIPVKMWTDPVREAEPLPNIRLPLQPELPLTRTRFPLDEVAGPVVTPTPPEMSLCPEVKECNPYATIFTELPDTDK